jgi:hypothetical protein
MNNADAAPLYHVWPQKSDERNAVELPALISRIKKGEVQARSWVFTETDGKWREAADIPELKMFFRKTTPGQQEGAAMPATSIEPGSLRRIKIFAEMDDSQLAAFLPFVKVLDFCAFSSVVRKGDHGDSMFLVLEGELRARTLVDARESTLSTLGPGDFFGEVALLDHGPRSADVLANEDSLLLEISGAAIEKIVREQPQSATPFLLALGKSLVGRTRNLTKRYEDTIHFTRAAGSLS